MDCLFCKIIAGDIPSNKIYEDDKILAFYDIAPSAPIHFLVIPKVHIPAASEITEEYVGTVGYIYQKIAEITKQLGVSSYRVVTNCGEDAGQTVFHLHFHVLAGKRLGAMA